jgi:hypothetical protein
MVVSWSWRELRTPELGLRVSAHCLTHIETNLPPGNKRVKHITHGGLRGPRCANPRSYYCKEANFLMYRWETSLRA